MTPEHQKFKTHPAAELFLKMQPHEIKELAEDIKANGLHEPIRKVLTPCMAKLAVDLQGLYARTEKILNRFETDDASEADQVWYLLNDIMDLIADKIREVTK